MTTAGLGTTLTAGGGGGGGREGAWGEGKGYRDEGGGGAGEMGGRSKGKGGGVADDRFICMQRGPRVIGMKGPATGASLPRPTASVPPSGTPLFCPTLRPCHQGPASRSASTRGCVTHRFTQVGNSYSPPPGKGQTMWTAGCL